MNNLPAKRKPVIDMVPEDRARDRAIRAEKISNAVARARTEGHQAGFCFVFSIYAVAHGGALIRGEAIEFAASWLGLGGSLLVAIMTLDAWRRARKGTRKYLEDLGVDQ